MVKILSWVNGISLCGSWRNPVVTETSTLFAYFSKRKRHALDQHQEPAMSAALLEVVRGYLDRHGEPGGLAQTPIPGLTIIRTSEPSSLSDLTPQERIERDQGAF
jgi:hypothetical protein